MRTLTDEETARLRDSQDMHNLTMTNLNHVSRQINTALWNLKSLKEIVPLLEEYEPAKDAYIKAQEEYAELILEYADDPNEPERSFFDVKPWAERLENKNG